MKILFIGTPPFSLPSLEALFKGGFRIDCVITRPDRPRGRGMRISPPPVKVLAERLNLKVYQPIKVRDEDSLAYIRKIGPDLIVVVAYGGILPKELLDLPPLGCINLHPSLLPKFRGPGAIHRCLIDGMDRTGVTTMYLDEGIDTGDIILQREVKILKDEIYGELESRLSSIGAELLIETLRLIEDGTAPRKAQDQKAATYAPLIRKEEGFIDWGMSADRIHNLIRGLSPSPGAYTYLEGCRIKIYRSKVVEGGGRPGEIKMVGKDRLFVLTPHNSLSLIELQPEGKKVMGIKEFLAGHRIKEGAIFHGYSEGTP